MPTPCANNAPYGHATGGGRIVVDPAARRRSDAGAGAVKTPTDVARYVLDSDGTVQPLEAMSSFGTAPFTIYTADPAGPPPFRQMLADGGWSGVAFSGSPSGRMTRLARQFADQYQVPAYQVVLDRAGKMKAVARGGGNGPAAVMVLDPAHPGEPTLHVLEHRGTRSAAMRSFLRNRVLRSVSFEGPGDSAGDIDHPVLGPDLLVAGPEVVRAALAEQRGQSAIDLGLGGVVVDQRVVDVDQGGDAHGRVTCLPCPRRSSSRR